MLDQLSLASLFILVCHYQVRPEDTKAEHLTEQQPGLRLGLCFSVASFQLFYYLWERRHIERSHYRTTLKKFLTNTTVNYLPSVSKKKSLEC